MSNRPTFSMRPLVQLTRVRILGFLREPEAVFWVFAFPVLMALAIGIAFRSQGPQKSRIGVEDSPRAARDFFRRAVHRTHKERNP